MIREGCAERDLSVSRHSHDVSRADNGSAREVLLASQANLDDGRWATVSLTLGFAYQSHAGASASPKTTYIGSSATTVARTVVSAATTLPASRIGPLTVPAMGAHLRGLCS